MDSARGDTLHGLSSPVHTVQPKGCEPYCPQAQPAFQGEACRPPAGEGPLTQGPLPAAAAERSPSKHTDGD